MFWISANLDEIVLSEEDRNTFIILTFVETFSSSPDTDSILSDVLDFKKLKIVVIYEVQYHKNQDLI